MFAISPDNCEWYTPLKIKQAVYKKLIKIDLDPCSNQGSPNIEASTWIHQYQIPVHKTWGHSRRNKLICPPELAKRLGLKEVDSC